MSPNGHANEPVNPNEHLIIPKWINEEYFQPILENDVDHFKSIIRLTPLAATAPGENYTSIMVRVVIDILLQDESEQQVSYILKTMLDASMGGDLVNNMNLFPKEKQMYQVHIPQFIQLYKEAGVDIELAPKCVHIEDTGECITLVLEDLKRQHFRNVDRLQGFDMPHMRRVLEKLAEFHAASVVNYELNGPYDPIYSYSMYSEKSRPIFVSFGEMRRVQYLKAMREWDLPGVERYIEKMMTTVEVFDAALQLNQVNEQEFNVLNHGDAWSNNIMFNYKENGEIDRTILVDLQVGKWGSPAQDLWYLITTSAALDIKVKEFDHFIKIYHQRLSDCLQTLKYTRHIPTLRELHMTMLKYGFWGPLTANGVLSSTIFPSDKDANISMLIAPGPEGDAIRYKTLVNPYYVNAMKQLLPFFEYRGVDRHN